MNIRKAIGLVVFVWAVVASSSVVYGGEEPRIAAKDREKISNIVSEELNEAENELALIGADTESAKSDRKFFKYLIKGLKSEKKRKYAAAAIFYEKALDVDRGELSGAEALFSLGRAYLMNKECKKAVSKLKAFLEFAAADLEEPGDYAYTAEGERIVRRKMGQAKWLIGLCE